MNICTQADKYTEEGARAQVYVIYTKTHAQNTQIHTVE